MAGVSTWERVLGICALASLLLINTAITLFTVNRSEERTREANQASIDRHCETLSVSIHRFKVYPPENEAQKQLQRDYLDLWDKNCKGE